MPDLLTNLVSSVNFLKRAPSSGSAVLDPPTTSAYSGLFYVTNYPPIPHGVDGIPLFRLYYRPYTDQSVWQPVQGRIGGATIPNPLDGSDGPNIMAWVDATYLYIQLYYGTNTLGRTTEVTWMIYEDFNLE